MKVSYTPARDEFRAERKRRYLEKWPMISQLEALSEAAMGRPEKLDEMTGDFTAIRESLPFHNTEVE